MVLRVLQIDLLDIQKVLRTLHKDSLAIHKIR